MLDFERYQWVSFDCYGTLVDWETGISDAVAEVLRARGINRSPAEILALFSQFEPQVQASGEYQDYRRVLTGVMSLIGELLGFQCTESESARLAETLPRWPVFPDAVAALRAMQSRYRLAIISNVDDDLFAGTAQELGLDFDAVITSQQAGRYKPNLANFEMAAERMSVEREAWLHVAESLFHDIGPANRLGVASVWVKRPDRGGGTRPTDAVADLVVSDLGELAGLMELAS